MEHSVLCYAGIADARFPPFLRGALSPVRVARFDTITADTLRPWWDAQASRYRFDGPLFFVSREKRVDLDFYPVADGFLASAPFVAILTRLAPAGLARTEVTMVDERGTPNTRQAMTFCQVVDRRSVCDVARMDIGGARHPELDSPNRTEQSHGVERIVTALHVLLKPDLPDLVAPADIPGVLALGSSRLRDACAAAGLQGPRFVPVGDIMVVDFFPHGPRGFARTSPGWRERRDLDLWPKPVVRADMFDPGSSPEEARRMLEALLKAQTDLPGP